LVFKAEKTETAYLCQCKQSKKKPFCDGTHKSV
jgi:CDGSH-type Zn-finger protein